MVSDVQTLKIYLSGILLQDTTSGKTQERGTHRIQATGHPVRRETSGWPEGKAGEVALVVKNPPANARHVRHASPIAGWGRSPWGGLQHSPVFLPGESPWVEEPGGLQSIGSERVRHNWMTKHSTCQGYGHHFSRCQWNYKSELENRWGIFSNMWEKLHVKSWQMFLGVRSLGTRLSITF